MSDLDAVLKGEVEETTEETVEETTEETETVESETADETEGETPDESQADESAEGETPAPEPESKPETPEGFVPIKGLQDERRKRQELEQRLAAMEKPSEDEKKDFWDDPEGRLSEIERKLEGRLLNERMNISEGFARKRWDDLDEKLETFKTMIEESPGLRDQMVKHPSPWEFVGEQVERYQRLQEFENAENYRKELETSFDKRVKDEAQKIADEMVEKRLKEAEQLPGSAADARQSAGRTDSDSSASDTPPTLDSILKSKG